VLPSRSRAMSAMSCDHGDIFAGVEAGAQRSGATIKSFSPLR